MSLRLALGAVPPRFAALFAAQGEYARAVPTLASLALPPATRLELFAYELVERAREAERAGTRLVASALWPGALFAACGVVAHPWGELERLLPPLSVSFQPLGAPALAAECARLALPALEPAAYAASLAELARARGWAPRHAPPAGFTGEPEQRTAAAFVLRAGRVLLERRPSDARVTPGVWDIPGGHPEPGESAQAALARELDEELALPAASARFALELDAREPPHGTRYRHAIFVLACTHEPRAREGQELAWFAPDEALALPDLNGPTAFALQELLESGALTP